MNKQFQSDIDIDTGDRNKILSIISHVPASILKKDELIPHNTGIYVTNIPSCPFNEISTIPHKLGEERGYIKLDILNVNLYNQIHNEEELIKLMAEPRWDLFNNDKKFFKSLTQIGSHWDSLKKMPEPVDSIPRLAMFMAIIRPAKRHLIGLSWKDVAKSIWDKSDEDLYGYKKSHAIAYAHLVVVHMNLLSNSAN